MRFLLDAHLSPAVARALQRNGFDALTLDHWHNGGYRDASDAVILDAAFTDAQTFITYDLRTIPQLLREWAETGRSHGGVILRSVRQADVGGLVRALSVLIQRRVGQAWRDQVVFLRAV